MRLEYDYITPEIKTMEDSINEQIRLVNCLSGQLLTQQTKIEEMKQGFKSDQVSEPQMVKKIKKEQQEISETRNLIFDTAKDLKDIKRFEFIKKRKIKVLLEQYGSTLESLSQKYELSKKELVNIHTRIVNHPEMMERVMYPNFKYHLRRFGFAVTNYEKLRKVVEKKTGHKLKKVNFFDVVKFTNEGGIEIQEFKPLESITFVKPYRSMEFVL